MYVLTRTRGWGGGAVMRSTQHLEGKLYNNTVHNRPRQITRQKCIKEKKKRSVAKGDNMTHTLHMYREQNGGEKQNKNTHRNTFFSFVSRLAQRSTSKYMLVREKKC